MMMKMEMVTGSNVDNEDCDDNEDDDDEEDDR